MDDAMQEAVLANADWCDGVCQAVGLATRWSADTWSVARRSPDGYPDAVTLRRALDVATVLSGVQTGEGCSVKDSFAELDLTAVGFSVLFEATWIRRRASTTTVPPSLSWTEVHTEDELTRWCRRLDAPLLPPSLLSRPGLHVLEATDVGAGFVLSPAGAVVSVGHAVPGAADPAALWSDLVVLAGRLHPGADLVGYEHGADLEHSLSAGFEATGPLRVWMS